MNTEQYYLAGLADDFQLDESTWWAIHHEKLKQKVNIVAVINNIR